MYLKSLRLLRPMVKEMHLQENILFDIDPKVKGSRSHEMLPCTLNIMLLHPMVKEMHLQENTLFDLDLGGQGHMKYCPVPSKSCDLCTYRV